MFSCKSGGEIYEGEMITYIILQLHKLNKINYSCLKVNLKINLYGYSST